MSGTDSVNGKNITTIVQVSPKSTEKKGEINEEDVEVKLGNNGEISQTDESEISDEFADLSELVEGLNLEDIMDNAQEKITKEIADKLGVNPDKLNSLIETIKKGGNSLEAAKELGINGTDALILAQSIINGDNPEKVVEDILKSEVSKLGNKNLDLIAENIGKSPEEIAQNVALKKTAEEAAKKLGVKADDIEAIIEAVKTGKNPEEIAKDIAVNEAVNRISASLGKDAGDVISIAQAIKNGEKPEKIIKDFAIAEVKNTIVDTLTNSIPGGNLIAGIVEDTLGGGEKPEEVKELKAQIDAKKSEIKNIEDKIKSTKPQKKDFKDETEYKAAKKQWEKDCEPLKNQIEELKSERDKINAEYRKLNPSFLNRLAKNTVNAAANAIVPGLGIVTQKLTDNM